MPERVGESYLLSGHDNRDVSDSSNYSGAGAGVVKPESLNSLQDIEAFVRGLEDEVAALRKQSDLFSISNPSFSSPPSQQDYSFLSDDTSNAEEQNALNSAQPPRQHSFQQQNPIPQTQQRRHIPSGYQYSQQTKPLSDYLKDLPQRKTPDAAKAESRSFRNELSQIGTEADTSGKTSFDPWENLYSAKEETVLPDLKPNLSDSVEIPVRDRITEEVESAGFITPEIEISAKNFVSSLNFTYEAPQYKPPAEYEDTHKPVQIPEDTADTAEVSLTEPEQTNALQEIPVAPYFEGFYFSPDQMKSGDYSAQETVRAEQPSAADPIRDKVYPGIYEPLVEDHKANETPSAEAPADMSRQYVQDISQEQPEEPPAFVQDISQEQPEEPPVFVQDVSQEQPGEPPAFVQDISQGQPEESPAYEEPLTPTAISASLDETQSVPYPIPEDHLWFASPARIDEISETPALEPLAATSGDISDERYYSGIWAAEMPSDKEASGVTTVPYSDISGEHTAIEETSENTVSLEEDADYIDNDSQGFHFFAPSEPADSQPEGEGEAQIYTLFGNLAAQSDDEQSEYTGLVPSDDTSGYLVSAGEEVFHNEITTAYEPLPSQIGFEMPSSSQIEEAPEERFYIEADAQNLSPAAQNDFIPVDIPAEDYLPEYTQTVYAEDQSESSYIFDQISDRMQAGMIVSEIQAEYSENNLIQASEEVYMVFENMTSIYNMKFQDSTSRPLYDSLNLSIPKGSCTAFISNTPLDVHALLRATKNRAGIKKGRIAVSGKGSDESPNLMYIENDSMITYGMPALQFLMLCLSEVRDRPVAKQEKLFNVLEEVGLAHIALADTKLLTRFQRIALLLITVAMSNLIDGVVLNPNKLSMDMADEYIVRKIFMLLYKTGKTVLFVGNNMMFTECVANRIVAMRDGMPIYDGEYRGFVEHYCESGFSFTTEDTDFIMNLRERFPAARFERRNDNTTIFYDGNDHEYLAEIVEAALEHGISSRSIVTIKKSFQHAVERMVNG